MENSEQTGLKELQKVDLGIAKVFVSICDKYDLTYYMLGGTMLGAIRHKGFIPWDDDMDFALFRDDYDKFLEIAPQELPAHLKLMNYINTPNYHDLCLRIADTDTKVIEERIGNENRNTFAAIDIFAIDGTPNVWLLRKIYIFRVLFHRAMISMCYKDSIDKKRKRGFAERCLIFVLDKIPIEKFTTPFKERDKIEKIMKKQKVADSKYVGNLMGAYREKEIVPVEFYGDGAMYTFEDTEFRGLIMYDEYLTWQYGDYMVLPPKEEIERKAHYKILELRGEKIDC